MLTFQTIFWEPSPISLLLSLFIVSDSHILANEKAKNLADDK